MTQSIRPLFVATILTGSFLLFLIQPMFGRMALPRLGGSPSVWNVAMLFYQAMLLGGYLYAHWLQRFALRTQIIVHAGLFLAAAAFLPIGAAEWLPDPGSTPPTLWLLGLLAVSIGPVFFIVSAQAPLMQAWFARSDDAQAMQPFFLYAASNLGSFSALLAYPFLVETTLRLKAQGVGWAAGYLVLMALTVGAGVAASKRPGAVRVREKGRVTWAQRLRWTVLALVPSALLLSTTTHLTTDVMAMPLLWVIPLAVYLISFILVFGRFGAPITRVAVAATPILLLLLGAASFASLGISVMSVALAGIGMLFVVSVALHGTLAMEKPEAADLTEFYLWMSVGGALGGLFCAIVAPLVFNWSYEYPILIVAAALMIPAGAVVFKDGAFWAAGTRSGFILRWVLPAATLGLSILAAYMVKAGSDAGVLALSAILAIAVISVGHNRQFAWTILMLMMALGGWRQIIGYDTPVNRTRSFFGIYSVFDSRSAGLRKLQHGTTLHGVQSLVPALATRPTTYYAPDSGVGQVFGVAPALFGGGARMAFVGLGTGTLACYARPGQSWTAFEIDPAMEAIARNTALFTYISACKPDLSIVIGDARLMLGKTQPGSFDMLAVDAFSSDAIPLHLMTREAFAVYQRALAPDGVLLVHVTNRYLRLEPIVAAIAAESGWSVAVRRFKPGRRQPFGRQDTESVWFVLTRTPARLDAVLAATPMGKAAWKVPAPEADAVVWTDDFASILPIIRF